MISFGLKALWCALFHKRWHEAATLRVGTESYPVTVCSRCDK